MRTDAEKIEQRLRNALTVGELIQQLQRMDPDAYPVFRSDYGDYHQTQQALPVGEVAKIVGKMPCPSDCKA
jgi:hypothetical protein